jgi:stage IV sporulation protein FB
MRWSFKVATIAGTEIKIHITFLLLVGWWGFDAWQQGGALAARTSVVFLLLVFGCILLHEFGHIVMARRFGIRTPDVLLSPIGGMARLERMPEEPKQELLVALAGPAVTLAIAVALWGVLQMRDGSPDLLQFDPLRLRLVPALFQLNVALLLFNLLPAFPMDGGRVLRAILASRNGLAWGTRVAARVGQVFAFAFGAIGIYTGSFLLLIIAGFVYFAAEAEARAVQTRLTGRGVTAGGMMVTDLKLLRVYATLEEAVKLLLAGEQREFPVVDNDGRLEGLLTRDDIVRGLATASVNTTVEQVMSRGVVPLTPGVPFEEALQRLRSSGFPALPVVNASGLVVGLLTADNIADLLLVRPHLVKSP